MTTQEKCVEEKGKGEDTNQTYEDNDVSNRHMTRWKKTWWMRSDDGSSMRSAKGRRRVWRLGKRPNRLAMETV